MSDPDGAWELMAASSLLLVVSGHRGGGDPVRSAGVWYTVMTHLGLVAILTGLVWLAAAAHSETFAGIKAAAPGQYRLSYKLTDSKKHTIEGAYVFAVAGAKADDVSYRFNDIELIPDGREPAVIRTLLLPRSN